MAMGPGVSATFRIIAVNDQHSTLYTKIKISASETYG
jgi:hypothetical protein